MEVVQSGKRDITIEGKLWVKRRKKVTPGDFPREFYERED